jgi:uncharacterized NAD(P)/FAD-binding protein YdhS
MKRIAIIGGGCSAAIVALQLLRQKEIPCEVEVFDPSEHLGLGVAYGTIDPLHCLNVPAARMGAIAEQPDDFFVWLQSHGYSYKGTDFVPRVVYAKYLTSRIDELRKETSALSTFTHLQKSVCRVSKVQGDYKRWNVTTTDGSHSSFDDVVLALGLPEGGWPRGIDGINESIKTSPSVFVEDVWAVPLRVDLSHKTVGILGTGLTAIDIAVSILSKETTSRVLLLSRHGLLPKSHFTDLSTPVPKEMTHFSGSLRDVIRKFRELCKSHRWDVVIDAIRPSIPMLWSSWTLQERERFIRHLRHIWDVHRHRMAPHIASQVSEWVASGRMQVISSRISEVNVENEKIKISFREKHSTRIRQVLIDTLYNCTGFRTLSQSDYYGLLHQMEKDALVRLDVSGSGVEPNPPLSLSLLPGLYILGALLRVVRWESIAVPELREQGREIVNQILAN